MSCYLRDVGIMVLKRLLGIAEIASLQEAHQEVASILIDQEKVEFAFKYIRDWIIFTNFRLIFVDKQGITGKKTEYHSIPYKSITHFSVETASTLDLDTDLKIWVSSKKEPFERKIQRGGNAML